MFDDKVASGEAFHSKGDVAWPYILRAQDSNSPELGRFECG